MNPLLGLMKFLHDVATVVWFGGLFAMGFILLPTAKEVLGMNPQMKKLVRVFGDRLSKYIYISIVFLIISGIPLSRQNPNFSGLFRFTNPYSAVLSIKHILVVLMIVVAFVRRGLMRRMAEVEQINQQLQEKRSMAILFLNILLGIAVLALSGLATLYARVSF